MKKKLVSITGAAALLVMLTGTIYAKEVPTEMAKVEVNNTNSQKIEVQKQEIEMLKLQVSQLENAVAPGAPKEAINKWADGVSTRNGAYQFALFSIDLREKSETYFTQNGWVTGTSSPWIDSYKITNEKKIDDTTYSFTIEFSLATSTGAFGNETSKVMVKKADDHWFIDKVEVKNEASIWERTPYIERKTFTYRAAEYAFSIPVEWDTKYRSNEKNGHLVFSYVPKNKAIPERTLFSIEKISEKVWNDGYEDSLYQKLAVKNGYVYAILPVSENQYADFPNSVEYKEFEEMCLDIKLLKNTFMFIN